MFVRIFMSTTGVVTILSGVYLIIVTILTLTSAPGRNVIFTFVFLAVFVCHGVAWLMAGLSKTLWK